MSLKLSQRCFLLIKIILGRRPRQADLSKHISLEWKSLTDEERAPFIHMSEMAKLEHQSKWPNYKYQPKRKTDGKKADKGVRSESVGRKAASSSPSKRSASRSKLPETPVTNVDEDEELCDINVDAQMSVAAHQFDSSVAQMSLSNLGLEVRHQGDEAMYVGGTEGTPDKDWTWLPEQTLLPISWEPDHELGNGGVLGDVMNPDVNAEDNEEEEFEFRVCLLFAPTLFFLTFIWLQKPFYLSFPPVSSNNHQHGHTDETPSFFPSFTAEPQSASGSAPAQHPFVDFGSIPSNFEFQGSASLGFHFDGFGDFASGMEDMDGPELR